MDSLAYYPGKTRFNFFEWEIFSLEYDRITLKNLFKTGINKISLLLCSRFKYIRTNEDNVIMEHLVKPDLFGKLTWEIHDLKSKLEKSLI
jgi:hypothetical protein